jgi:hypothetical protein
LGQKVFALAPITPFGFRIATFCCFCWPPFYSFYFPRSRFLQRIKRIKGIKAMARASKAMDKDNCGEGCGGDYGDKR